MSDEVKVTKLPPGEALGAHDLQRWSSNRSAGRSGSYMTKDERQRLQRWRCKQSMSIEQSLNGGALFRNHDKRDPKYADYSGSISIEGVGEFWLNGWIKEGPNGKFLSLSVKPKQQKPAPIPA
jgi:hypothetical protein